MLKTIRNKSVKRIIFYSAVFILALFCAFRIYDSYRKNMGIDFTVFYSCTYAAVRGQDFYDVKNLIFHDWKEPPIVSPGLLFFYMPYMLFDINIARLIYYILSLSASIFVYTWMFKLSGFLKKADFRNPNLSCLLFFGGMFVFLNSSPQLMCQRNGQVGIWVWLLLLILFSIRNKYLKSVLFGFSAVFKYPMLTFFAPLLWFKKQYFICIAGFVVFLLICMWPGLLGYDVVNLYTHNIKAIINSVGSGCNSYELAGQDLLQVDYFRLQLLNIAGKLFFGITMLFILWRERNKEGIGLNLMLLVFCLTMLVSYHRLYDNIIVVLLLLLKTSFLIEKKDWKRALPCGCFLVFYMVPISIVFKIADFLGRNVSVLSSIFYTSPYAQYTTILPVVAFSQTALGLYVIYLYFKTDDDYVFSLKNGK